MLIFFLICLIIQIVYWGIVFMRFAFFMSKKSTIDNLPIGNPAAVSVVICARNESANLQKNLPIILTQNYPKYEVVVVDDASDDDSLLILKELELKFEQLKVVSRTEKKDIGKKSALALGIQTAQYEWILLTDADCVPHTQDWILEMQAAIHPNTEIVLGYSPYRKYDTFINKWICYETTYTLIQYAAFALWGQPYMGVGRNLMYKKELFVKNNNFNAHSDLASGDDDLFVNPLARKENTILNLNVKTWVISEPKHHWKSLYVQKTRHYSTSTRYRFFHQILLGILVQSHFWLYFCAGVLLACQIGATLVLMGLLARWILLSLVWFPILIKLKQKDLIVFIWLFDIFIAIYYLILAPSLFFKNRSLWK